MDHKVNLNSNWSQIILCIIAIVSFSMLIYELQFFEIKRVDHCNYQEARDNEPAKSD